MSFATNQFQQISIQDATFGLTAREQRILKGSWAEKFSENVFPMIDEEPFAVLFSDRPSRANDPVNVQIGLLILKELHGLTDEEAYHSLLFDVRYQYALHTTSFEEQPINERSLGRLRARCISYEEATGVDLLHKCITSVSAELAKFMNISPQMKRMDSLMVESNIKKMGRLELLYTCVANLCTLIGKKEEGKLPGSLAHYLRQDDHNRVLYHNRSEETEGKIRTVLEDAALLFSFCGSRYDEYSEYQLLVRVIGEQAVRGEDGSYQLKDKKSGGMGPDILQNPADPDATYCEKAGKEHRGYAANIVEAADGANSIVMDYQYDQNTHSDSQFLKEYIAGIDEEALPSTLVTDGGYSGQENTELAEAKNIHLVTTDLKGRDAKDIWADFEFSEDGKKLIHCANGLEPKSCTYNPNGGKCRISFPIEACKGCPHQQQCCPEFYVRVARLDLSAKTAERAKVQRYMGSEEFRQYSRYRNGVESIPSILRRKYHVDRMPVRGKLRTKLFFGCKIGALNVSKLFKYLEGLDRSAPKTVMA